MFSKDEIEEIFRSAELESENFHHLESESEIILPAPQPWVNTNVALDQKQLLNLVRELKSSPNSAVFAQQVKVIACNLRDHN